MNDLLKDDQPQFSMVRMAEVVMGKLAILSEKREDVRKARALLLNMMKKCLKKCLKTRVRIP